MSGSCANRDTMAGGIPLPCISARCAAAQPIAHELLAKLNEFLSPASGSATKGINYWVNNLTHGTGSITLDPGVVYLAQSRCIYGKASPRLGQMW